jgi:hypothetical protein
MCSLAGTSWKNCWGSRGSQGKRAVRGSENGTGTEHPCIGASPIFEKRMKKAAEFSAALLAGVRRFTLPTEFQTRVQSLRPERGVGRQQAGPLGSGERGDFVR